MGRGADILSAIQRERPLVHHITNVVTIKDCADITLSAGALPVMAHAREEVEEMVVSAGAAVINIGTLSPPQVEAMICLGQKAAEKGIPVVFDPVGAGATAYRTETAKKILREVKPPLVKGNAAEIASLAGVKGARISGVSSLSAGADPLEVARALSDLCKKKTVIAVTGEVDAVTDGERSAHIYNGHPLLPQVVGSGCMAASLAAVFAAVELDCFWAAVYALALVGVAGELAAEKGRGERSPGPAEYRNLFLDAVYHLSTSGQEFDRRTKIKVE